MNDYVKISKNLTDEIPNFSSCMTASAYYSKGENYSLQIHKMKKQYTEIDVSLNEANGTMTVKGNLGMFWKGHNILFTFDEMRKSLEYISDRLRVDLFPAEVKEFDHSAVISTDLNPNDVFHKHINIPGHERVQQKNGLYFNNPGIQVVKLYDAGKRLIQLNSKANRELIYTSIGFDPMQKLIRFEKKIKHPHKYFKRLVSLSDLIQPKFIDLCNLDLIETYASMQKLNNLIIPTDKKDLSAATIPLIVAKELEDQFGFDLEDLIKRKISSIPESSLSKDDKKARRRQIKANLNRISKSMAKEYDLTESLIKSLKMASN